jgi:esterase/lipase superfamily enzyme/Tfp pilus assembly protein PilF
MTKLLHWVASLVVTVTISLPAPAAAEMDGEAALDARVVELRLEPPGWPPKFFPFDKAIQEKAVRPDDPDVAQSLNNLAARYQNEGRYGDAEQVYKRALAIYEKALGPVQPAVAQSLNNLATLYQIEGRYGDAEPLYQRALAIYEALGPSDHPDVATTLNDLAALSQNEGRFDNAEELYKRALAIRERMLGPDHPAVATTLNNLAAFYQKQGRLTDAEPLYTRALAIRERTLGPDHPDVAQSLNNLAALYQNQGRYGDAEPLYERALSIYEKALGPDNIEVSWSLNNLANLYEDRGRFSDAEPLYKRAVTIREKGLGADQRSNAPPSPPAPPIGDPRLVEVLFASTRQETSATPANTVSYSGERGLLTFGAASLRIPPDHKIGHIERPSSWSLFGITFSSTPNEREHFVIKQLVSLSEDAFDQAIRKKGAKTALVFVHGFHTTFEDALYRNAQIAWDLQYSGVSVLFTWASRGKKVTDYIYDKESAYLAREAFIAVLEKLKREYGIEQVNVLAHSMGNLIAVDALANYARTSNPVQIAHLVMAAPDVDRDQFLALVPVAKTIVGGMTIYASSADRALAASRELAGGVPRAGDVPADGPIILANVETIDVTAMGEDIFGLNHSVFADSRDVLEDISALLRLNLPPPRLIQIRPVPEPPAATRYWRYVR